MEISRATQIASMISRFTANGLPAAQLHGIARKPVSPEEVAKAQAEMAAKPIHKASKDELTNLAKQYQDSAAGLAATLQTSGGGDTLTRQTYDYFQRQYQHWQSLADAAPASVDLSA